MENVEEKSVVSNYDSSSINEVGIIIIQVFYNDSNTKNSSDENYSIIFKKKWRIEKYNSNALTAPVDVATNERTFSQLKLIKNHLRSTTKHNRLDSLMILSIEKDLAEKLNFKK